MIFFIASLIVILTGFLTLYHLSAFYFFSFLLPGCSETSFFSCDLVLNSSLSSFLGIPTAYFGFILGVLVFFAKGREETFKFLLLMNLIGCLLLFLYTLFYLQSFCPYCFAYYVLSISLYFLYRKYSFDFSQKDTLILSFIGSFLIFIFMLVTFLTKPNKNILTTYCHKIEKILPEGIPLEIHEGPVVTIIGDFECPSCEKLYQYLAKKDLNLFYLPYPLNTQCNSFVKRTKHEESCHRTYYALKHRVYPPKKILLEDFEDEKIYLKNLLEKMEIKSKILPILVLGDYICPGLIQEDLIDKVFNEVF